MKPARRSRGALPPTLDHQVMQVYGKGDVLQPMLPEVSEGSPLGKGVLNQPR